MSHVTCEWVISYLTESVLCKDMSHVTNTRVMSHTNKSCHILQSQFCLKSWQRESCHEYMSHVAYECGMSIYKWVILRMNQSWHVRISTHVAYTESCHVINESCRVWMSHVACEWGISRNKWVMSRMNQSWHVRINLNVAYDWVMSHNQCVKLHINEVCHVINESCCAATSHDTSECAHKRNMSHYGVAYVSRID